MNRLSVNIVYWDFLSGRIPIPLDIVTRDDSDGFSNEIIVLGVDLEIVFDDGSVSLFPKGTELNEVSNKAELINESLNLTIDDITIWSNETIEVKREELIGTGFYDGLQEWWFITRKISGKTEQLLRFNLRVVGNRDIFFSTKTSWTRCVEVLETIDYAEDFIHRNREPVITEFCTRGCYSPCLPKIHECLNDKEFQETLKDILES